MTMAFGATIAQQRIDMTKLKETEGIEKKAARGRRYATRNADELPVNGAVNGNGTAALGGRGACVRRVHAHL